MSQQRKFSFLYFFDRASQWLLTAVWLALSAISVLLINVYAPDDAIWPLRAKLVLYVIAAFGAAIALMALFLLQAAFRSRKKLKYGVLWDRDGNPVCGKCDGPLFPTAYKAFGCSACQISYPPFDLEDGLDPWDALKRVRDGK